MHLLPQQPDYAGYVIAALADALETDLPGGERRGSGGNFRRCRRR